MKKLKDALSKVGGIEVENVEVNLPAQETSRASSEVSEKLIDRDAIAEEKLKKSVRLEPAVKKIVKAAARLADLITDEDRIENIRVIRDAKKAKTRLWNHIEKRWEEMDDCKTQMAAATLQLAYDEGLPVKRSIVLTGDFSTAEELVKMVNQSPAAQQAIDTLKGMGVTLEMDGEIISEENRETPPPSE